MEHPTSTTPSFEEFYVDLWPWAVRVATLMTQSQDAGPDVAQESFFALYRRWGAVDQPKAYLRRSLANSAQNWHRRQRNQRRKLPLLHQPDVTAAMPSEMADVLARLPFRQRSVLVLRYYGDLSEAEIAETLGCRPGTVKSLASRALAQLRKEVSR